MSASADKGNNQQQIVQAAFDVSAQAHKVTPVSSSGGTPTVDTANKLATNHFTHDYVVPVTTGAYTSLGTTGAVATEIEIFDSSGQLLVLAFSTTDQIFISPGGNGRIPLAVPAGTNVQIKAVTATADAGFISVNFYGEA